MNNALNELLHQFSILKLNVTVQLQQDTVLPEFKGSMLHGWFGHALKAASEQAFFVCYGEHDQQQPKPYIICPNGDLKTHWHQGELYQFELTLFGHACELIDNLVVALKMGEQLGWGPKRTRFKVLNVASHTQYGLQAGLHPSTLLDLVYQTPIATHSQGAQELAMVFHTPMRLKHDGKIIKHSAPNIDFWCNQILRRLTQLSRFWANDNPNLFDAIYSERPLFDQVEHQSHCYFEDWQRFSLKQQEQLPFGGLKGQVSFYGQIHHAIPLLRLGQLLHLGGKTTFGLGQYQLIE